MVGETPKLPREKFTMGKKIYNIDRFHRQYINFTTKWLGKTKMSNKVKDVLVELYNKWSDRRVEEENKWYGDEQSIGKFLDDLEEIINDEELFNGQ